MSEKLKVVQETQCWEPVLENTKGEHISRIPVTGGHLYISEMLSSDGIWHVNQTFVPCPYRMQKAADAAAKRRKDEREAIEMQLRNGGSVDV